jgi:hypothetical protein
MIRSYKRLIGSSIQALDGDIGKLKDVYFDDLNWNVRYFVIELGSWFSGKCVLVPPSSISPFDGTMLKVELTKAELRSCPHSDEAIPVSLQLRYNERTSFDLASNAGCLINAGHMITPVTISNDCGFSENNPHLRSCKAVSEYKLLASDGDIGAVKDILIDDSLWLIRFLTALTKVNLESLEKLYRSEIINEIQWSSAVISLSMTRKQALDKPHFDPLQHLDTSYEFLVKSLENDQRKKQIRE